MFTEPLTGATLPQGTLCLTFDDGPGETAGVGPGPRTLELGRYLADLAVPAAFFLAGKYVLELPYAPKALAALGFTVGNHSQQHVDLVEHHAAGGDVLEEVRATAALIADAVDGPIYFRPPYGAWSAELATVLNADDGLAATHLGPVLWDIDGHDWAHWRDRHTPRQCADAYLAAIEAAGRGVVLQHDCTADSDAIKAGNRTFETVQLLVPELRQRGYAFAGLTEAVGHLPPVGRLD